MVILNKTTWLNLKPLIILLNRELYSRTYNQHRTTYIYKEFQNKYSRIWLSTSVRERNWNRNVSDLVILLTLFYLKNDLTCYIWILHDADGYGTEENTQTEFKFERISLNKVLEHFLEKSNNTVMTTVLLDFFFYQIFLSNLTLSSTAIKNSIPYLIKFDFKRLRVWCWKLSKS